MGRPAMLVAPEDRALQAMVKLHSVGVEEKKITPTVKALVSLFDGELAGLEHRFKSETSLFRKVMARLDKGIEAAAGEAVPPPRHRAHRVPRTQPARGSEVRSYPSRWVSLQTPVTL